MAELQSTHVYGGLVVDNTMIVSDGSQSLPSYSFSSDVDTGLYLSSTGTIAFTAGGAIKFYVNINQNRSYVPIWAPGETSSSPSYSFSDDTDTGMYLQTTAVLGWSIAGTAELYLSSNNLYPVTTNGLHLGGSGNYFNNGYISNIYGTLQTAAQTNITSVGTLTSLTTSGLITSGTNVKITTTGSAAAPSLYWSTDTNSGVYREAENIIGISTAGISGLRVKYISATEQQIIFGNAAPVKGTMIIYGSTAGRYGRINHTTNLHIDTDFGTNAGALYLNYYKGKNVNFGNGASSTVAQVTSTGLIRANLGLIGTPGFSFIGDDDTGMYRYASNDLGFATAAGLRMAISSTRLYTAGSAQIHAAAGTVSLPAYSFTGTTSTGMYRYGGGDAIGFSCGGSNALVMSVSQTASYNDFDPGASNTYKLGYAADYWAEIHSGTLDLYTAGSDFYNPSSHDSLGTLKLFPYSSSTVTYATSWTPTAVSQRHTFNWASLLPTGTKAVLVSIMTHAYSAAAGIVQFRHHYDDNNAITPAYNTNVASSTLIFSSPGVNQYGAGTTVELIIPVDGSKYFYGYISLYTNLNGVIVYYSLRGYYI